ncbi:MAG: 3-oxocholest-4-en-26-oate---CoA ligase, partial [Actinomycetota bacterium]|nr:3-oxocholest-4-en-26-oate---CoA ligase [Actinomycetota bacterium]
MADVQRHYNFADLFEMAADKVPDRVAIIDKRREITYRELDERATRFAHALQAAGIQAGDHVGVLATNCIEWVEAMYGIYKIRARVVNVNFRYVEEEMRYLFDNSDLVALVYQREYGPIVAAARDAQPKLQHFYRIEWDGSDADDSQLDPIEFEAAIASGSPERDFGERSDDDVYLLYTGGTTGMPKGVMWRQ